MKGRVPCLWIEKESMKLTEPEIEEMCVPFGRTGSRFFRRFLVELNERIGADFKIRFRIFRPRLSREVDLSGIDSKTVLILWGDEESRVFPHLYAKRAGAILKPYCPDRWLKKGIIPMTDVAMNSEECPEREGSLLPCSQRPYTVMFSANLNFRRTDIYRGCCGCSVGYPFRVSSNYPVTGSYPLWHKIEAVAMHKLLTLFYKRMDFSELYPRSYIRFNCGFMKGALSSDEYLDRLSKSKISWCTAGFMTNETSRLLESSRAGCAVICGELPDNELYKGHPFHIIRDWRKVRQETDMLLADESRMDELGAASRRWYESHFSPEAQARRISRLLKGN